MDHAALDRPGPHDRHLDDEVVVGARLQPRQHRHLRPALDLEHADACRPGRSCRRPRDPRSGCVARSSCCAVVLARSDRSALRMQVSMPSASTSTLIDAQRVEVVLVPFDDGAVRHGGVLDRHQLVEPARGQDEAADVLRQVAGEAAAASSTARAPGAVADRRDRGRPRARARCRRLAEPMPQTVSASAPIDVVATGPAPCRPRGWRCGCDSG